MSASNCGFDGFLFFVVVPRTAQVAGEGKHQKEMERRKRRNGVMIMERTGPSSYTGRSWITDGLFSFFFFVANVGDCIF